MGGGGEPDTKIYNNTQNILGNLQRERESVRERVWCPYVLFSRLMSRDII